MLFEIKIIRIDKARTLKYNENNRKLRWMRFIGAKSKEERDYYAKGDRLLMEFNDWLDDYLMDRKTQARFNEWSMRLKQEEIEVRSKEAGILEANYKNALNMIQDDMSIDLIMKYTGLTEDEILEIKRNN